MRLWIYYARLLLFASIEMTVTTTFAQEQLQQVEENDAFTVLDDSNIRQAVQDILTGNFRDQAVARELYGGPIEDWDTSRVTNMAGLFAELEQENHAESLVLNPPIEYWNVERVTSLAGTFRGLSTFDRDLSGWNVSRVTDLSYAFHGTTNFTGGGLGEWNTRNVIWLNDAFSDARIFNAPLSTWDTSSVVSFQNTFRNAASFNQDLSTWSLAKAVSVQAMFQGAQAMNQTLCLPTLRLSTSTTPVTTGPATVLTNNFLCDSPVELDPCCVADPEIVRFTCCQEACNTDCPTSYDNSTQAPTWSTSAPSSLLITSSPTTAPPVASTSVSSIDSGIVTTNGGSEQNKTTGNSSTTTANNSGGDDTEQTHLLLSIIAGSVAAALALALLFTLCVLPRARRILQLDSADSGISMKPSSSTITSGGERGGAVEEP